MKPMLEARIKEILDKSEKSIPQAGAEGQSTPKDLEIYLLASIRDSLKELNDRFSQNTFNGLDKIGFSL